MAHDFASPFSPPRPEAAERADLLAALENGAAETFALSQGPSENREDALAEHRTSARYIAWLGEHGFAVETPVAGLATAFVARHGAATAPLRAALLAEMNDLPEAAHELSGPVNLLAATALAVALPASAAQLVVLGTHCEASGESLRALVAAGVFDEVDCAISLSESPLVSEVVPTVLVAPRSDRQRRAVGSETASHTADRAAGHLEAARGLALCVLELARKPAAREAVWSDSAGPET